MPVMCVHFELPGVCFCQELVKLDSHLTKSSKYKKGDVFSETQCISGDDKVCFAV